MQTPTGLGACLALCLTSGVLSPQDRWTPGFHLPGLNRANSSGRANAAVVFDDGDGPALYVGGGFTSAGSAVAGGVARWNGTRWTGVGNLSYSEVWDLAVFDDGAGARLYAASESGVLRWDGTDWTNVGAPAGGTTGAVGCFGVFSLTTYDEGSGLALYAGGDFTSIEGVPANNLAGWDGTTWTALGSGLTGAPPCYESVLGTHNGPPLAALEVFRDSVGNEVLACGGTFTQAGGSPAAHLAQWDGSAWSAIGGGWPSAVDALAAFDDGTGLALYAATSGFGGNSGLQRWDGTAFTTTSSQGGIDVLVALEDSGGDALYLGGPFAQYAGVPTRGIVRWDGSQFSGLDGGILPSGSFAQNEVRAIAAFDEGQGTRVFACGSFEDVAPAAPVRVNHVARWSGGAWSALGSAGHGATAEVSAMLRADLGAGEVLLMPYVSDHGVQLGVWDGARWSPFATPLIGNQRGSVNDLALYDAGGGGEVYACGDFHTDELDADLPHIARWDGSIWRSLRLGLNGEAHDLLVWDDGGGPALFVAGEFTQADGIPVNGVARWDGALWSDLGGGFTRFGGLACVQVLAVWDDGTGPALYAGGDFTESLTGTPIGNLARWDGMAWSEVGGGVGNVTNGPSVRSLLVFDDGGGEDLYVGGNFSRVGPQPGGLSANRIARWSGSAWSALGGGPSDAPRALAGWFDGASVRLVTGEQYWNGSAWRSLGLGVHGSIQTLASYDDGVPGRPALYVGGSLDEAGLHPSAGLARWGALWPASAVVRNGTGMNTPCYSSTTLPVLGQDWITEVDHSAHPGALSTLIVGKAQPASIPTHLGEVLVSGPRFFRHTVPSAGASDSHVIAIPIDLALVGATVATQAVVIGGGIELCNALDIAVGF